MNATKHTLPKDWRWEKLKDITRIVAGTTPKSGVNEYWNNGEIVWITPTDLGGNSEKDIVTSTRLITKIGFESCGLEIVPPGSIVLSSRAPIGYLGIARIPLCTNQGCKSFVPSEQIDSLFLYYALKQSVTTLQKLGSGATFAEVSKTQLENFEIPLPPIDEQKRIAARLDGQMGHIEQARQAAEESLYAAWDLPLAYLSDVFNSQTAKSWETKFIKDFAESGSGATPLRSKQEYFKNGNIPWVKTGELKDSFIDDSEEHITELALKETSLRLFPANTLLIAMYGQGQTRGRTSIITKPMTTNQACFAILPNEQFDTEYIQMWFQFSYDRLRRETEGRGGNQPNLNGIVLRNQKALLPNLDIQKQVVSKVKQELSETKQLTQSLESQLAEINELPSALLRQAFAGEL